jgi:hypothetical protein
MMCRIVSQRRAKEKQANFCEKSPAFSKTGKKRRYDGQRSSADPQCL